MAHLKSFSLKPIKLETNKIINFGLKIIRYNEVPIGILKFKYLFSSVKFWFCLVLILIYKGLGLRLKKQKSLISSCLFRLLSIV